MCDENECEQLIAILKAFHEINPKIAEVDYDKVLSKIFEKFHICARQLKRRHAGRPTLEIKDEYDVQDLLNAILRLHFEDVRPEEWTPSYAGGNNRMDFLLKNEEISIEVKMTRDGLKDKELGDQLIIDIAVEHGEELQRIDFLSVKPHLHVQQVATDGETYKKLQNYQLFEKNKEKDE